MQTRYCRHSEKLMKVVNIADGNLHVFENLLNNLRNFRKDVNYDNIKSHTHTHIQAHTHKHTKECFTFSQKLTPILPSFNGFRV